MTKVGGHELCQKGKQARMQHENGETEENKHKAKKEREEMVEKE